VLGDSPNFLGGSDRHIGAPDDAGLPVVVVVPFVSGVVVVPFVSGVVVVVVVVPFVSGVAVVVVVVSFVGGVAVVVVVVPFVSGVVDLDLSQSFRPGRLSYCN
jgi:hypothetical protein